MTDDKPRRPKCAMCRQPIDLRPQNPDFPFCSEHCRMRDLGNWFNESYRIAVGRSGTERNLPEGEPH